MKKLAIAVAGMVGGAVGALVVATVEYNRQLDRRQDREILVNVIDFVFDKLNQEINRLNRIIEDLGRAADEISGVARMPEVHDSLERTKSDLDDLADKADVLYNMSLKVLAIGHIGIKPDHDIVDLFGELSEIDGRLDRVQLKIEQLQYMPTASA